jgi:hypothetical protein
LPDASTSLKLSATTEQLALDSAALLLTELMLLENRGWELWGLAAARLVPMAPTLKPPAAAPKPRHHGPQRQAGGTSARAEGAGDDGPAPARGAYASWGLHPVAAWGEFGTSEAQDGSMGGAGGGGVPS